MRSLTTFWREVSEGYITPGITLLYHCHNPYDDPMSKDKDFKSYPTRAITLSDEAWDILKTEKLKSQKTWTNFILDLFKHKR